MTKNDIINELNEMGYKVKEQYVMKNGVKMFGISIIDSDRYMIPVFYAEDIIMKAEQTGATVKDIVNEMLQIHNDAVRESEELNKPLYFNREEFLKRIYVGVQKESTEDIIKSKTEFDGIEKYLFLRIEGLNGLIGSAKIYKRMLENADVEESEAWKIAEENVRKETQLVEILAPPTMLEDENEMFIISNKLYYRGASAVLDKKVMKAFSEMVGTKKIMVLPSSIHEMILLPYHESEYDVEICSEIVKITNENEVEPTEQLADRAYIIEV